MRDKVYIALWLQCDFTHSLTHTHTHTHSHALCNYKYVRKVKGTLSFVLIKQYEVKPREEGRSPSFLNSGNAG
jgi:hypothetical protein